MIYTLFTCLLTLQFVVVAAHDLVDIPGWTHGSQVQSIVDGANCGWQRVIDDNRRV